MDAPGGGSSTARGTAIDPAVRKNGRGELARPNWEYIRVDVQLPEHSKLDGLSYAAKWTLIELWCWCGEQRTDGFVRDAKWATFGPRTARDSLVKAGLAHRVAGGYQMHDFVGPDGHQRTRAEIAELSAKRSEAAKRSVEARAKAKANAPALAEHDAEQTGSKPPAEAEAEAEADRSVVDEVDQPADRNAPATDEIDLIIEEIRQATGRTISAEWAIRTRSQILAGRQVSDRASYLRHAIRSENSPRTRFLPASQPPPAAEVIAVNGSAARGDTVHAIAAQARQAITKPKDSP